ncbi:MAG: alginate export family protein [Deltaproteobacteria bacterium]|nr:alginate export family protein [Deltaproteobacteria bacterium]
MRRNIVCMMVMSGLVIGVGAGQAAARGKWKSKSRISGDAAVLDTLLEDQDSLNMITAGHTKQIGQMKERITELEDRLKKAEADVAAARKKADAAKSGADAVSKDMVEVKDRFTDRGETLPKFIPHFEFRVRPEYTTNRRDLDSTGADEDMFYLQRVRLGATLEPQQGIRGTIVIQDSRTWGEIPGPGVPRDHLGLYEGYILLTDLWTPGFEVQAGRFAMGFGLERQIGRDDWGNRGRAFDGVRVAYHKPRVIQIDAFATVIQDARTQAGPNEDFYGLHLATDALDFMDFQIYGFYLNNDTAGASAKIGTVGARIEARPVKGLVMEGEAAVQFGKVDNVVANGVKSIDHLATAYAFSASYAVPVTTSPTIGLVFHSASGDANPGDDRSTAYRVLFPTRHDFYGSMDLFQWQGVWEIGPLFSLAPVKEVLFKAVYHAMFLSTNGGVLTDAFGGKTTFPADSGKFLGHELDLLVHWDAMKWLALETGYSLFKPGDVTAAATTVSMDKGSTALGSDLAHWFYFQAKASF